MKGWGDTGPRSRWGGLLRGSLAISAGFVLFRFLLTPVRMQVLTRVLTPEAYGVVTLLSMTASALAMILSAGGFEWLLRCLPAADPQGQLRAFRSVFTVSSALIILSCGVVLAVPESWFSVVSGGGTVSRPAVAVMFLLFMHIHQRLYYLLGCRRHFQARITQLLWSDAWFLAVIPWGLAAVWTAEHAVWAWCLWLAVVVLVTGRWVPVWRLWSVSGGAGMLGRMLGVGLPMMPVLLAEWMFRLVGQYVLLVRIDAGTMALYALAFNIAGIGYVVGVPLIDALTTEFNAVRGTGGGADDPLIREAARRIISRAVRFVLAVSVPAGLAFIFLADPVVRLLAGPAFAPTAGLLPWTAVIPGFLLMNLLLARLLLADGRSGSVGVISLAGGLVALGLCLPWVDRFGARGALAAVTVGLALTSGGMGWQAKLSRWLHPGELRVARMIAGTFLMAVVFAVLGWCAALPMVRLALACGVTVVVLIGSGWVRLADFPKADHAAFRPGPEGVADA